MTTAALLLLTGKEAFGLPVDVRLDRSIAFEARIEPLPVVLDRLRQASGVTITVERRLMPLKATILVPARPVRRTLSDLANVFDARWIPVDGGYRLEETISSRNRREAQLKLEEGATRKLALNYLAGGAYDPFERGIPSGFPEDRLDAMRTEALAIQRETATFFQSFPQEARDRFWQGEPLSKFVIEGPIASRQIRLIRYHRDDGHLDLVEFRPSGGRVRGMGFATPDPASLLEKSSFVKAQVQWATDLTEASLPELSLPLRESNPLKPRWFRGVTDSDRLEELHRRTGIPVVAEANRQQTGERVLFSEKTLGEALQGGNRLGGYLRFENGTLLQRPELFWRQRRVEPSEAAMVSVESVERPGLDEIAETFAKIPIGLFRQLHRCVSRFDFMANHHHTIALRIWGMLTPQQRAGLRAGRTIPLTATPLNVQREARSLVDDLFGMFGARFYGTASTPADHPSQIFGVKIALLGEGPAHPLHLRFDSETSENPLPVLPPGTWVRSGAPNPSGVALHIEDDDGAGVRLFIAN